MDRNRIPLAIEFLPAELWQGAEPIDDAGVEDFDLIVNCSYELPNVPMQPGTLYVRGDLRDAEVEEQEEKIQGLAKLVAGQVRQGQRVLVHCSQGWNRSGVVVARSLIELDVPPDVAIELVRKARHPMVLSNPSFVAWLMREGPSVASDLAEQERV